MVKDVQRAHFYIVRISHIKSLIMDEQNTSLEYQCLASSHEDDEKRVSEELLKNGVRNELERAYEEQIKEILTKLSPTQELFTAINKCNMNIFEILSR